VLARTIAVAALLADIFLWYLNVRNAFGGNSPSLYIGMVLIRLDGIGLLLTSITLLLGLLVTVFSIPYMAKEANEEKFYALLLMTIGQSLALASRRIFSTCGSFLKPWPSARIFWSLSIMSSPPRLKPGSSIWYSPPSVRRWLCLALPPSLRASVRPILQHLAAFGQPGRTGHHRYCVDDRWFWCKGRTGSHAYVAAGRALTGPSGISAMLSGIVIEAGLIAMIRSISLMENSAEAGVSSSSALPVLYMLVVTCWP
jgi:hypothetical protein